MEKITFEILKDINFSKLFISILQILVGILILSSGAGLIYLAITINNNNLLQYALLIIGFCISCFGLFIMYKKYWKNKEPINLENTSKDDNQEINNYRNFVNNLNLEEFDEILLIVHTGRNSLEILRQKLISDNFTHNIDIKILLKHPFSETTDRFEQIENHLPTLIHEINRNENSTIDFRYYNGLPHFHAILCKYKNIEQYKSYISYYKWKKHKTVASPTGTVINKDSSELFLVAKSLFEHLFSKKNLHTIIFDLDDTIIDSYNSQMKSWKFLLECIFNDKHELSYLRDNIQSYITEESFEQYIENMFLQTTETDERFNCIFTGLPDGEIKKIKKIRFNIREELTIDEAPLFTECRKTLKELSKTYNLVIISATSEKLVKKVLDKYDLNSYFSFYLGVRDNQVDLFDKAEIKTPHLIKTSHLLGIPFDRIAFVGDSPTDFKAAKQLNIRFIAANMVATRLKHQSSSFITVHNGLSFDSYRNGSLLNIINENFN